LPVDDFWDFFGLSDAQKEIVKAHGAIGVSKDGRVLFPTSLSHLGGPYLDLQIATIEELMEPDELDGESEE